MARQHYLTPTLNNDGRCYRVLHHTDGLRNAGDWTGLTTIGLCHSERTIHGVSTEETRYCIGSRKTSAKVYGKALRDHWGIENTLHWQLDVTFNEDHNRVTKRNAAENLGLLRRLTVSLLQAHPAKLSVAKKRFAAALDPNFSRRNSSRRRYPGEAVMRRPWILTPSSWN